MENLNTIDFISIDKDGNVVLTVSDHLEWDVQNEHLVTLQNKLNVYLIRLITAVYMKAILKQLVEKLS